MKKSLLIFSISLLGSVAMFAQNQIKSEMPAPPPVLNAPVPSKPGAPMMTSPVQQAPTAQVQPAEAAKNADLSMKFEVEDHDFGNIPEGPAVSYDFEFKNIGKEAITLSEVRASCGCTTPSWSKEPIAPKKSSKITATFNTQGRPGPFTKQITVVSNVGTKIIKFHGTVEPAPKSSVPENNNSIMKH